MNTIYIESLNDYCRKYFVQGEVKYTKQDELLKGRRFQKVHAELFENLLLSDRLNFKVYGENIPLSFLINSLGIKSVEELIERNALNFTLWTPMVGHATSFIQGVVPVIAGRFNQGPHSDPIESISEGLKWMIKGVDGKTKKMIIKKVRDLYVMPKEGIEHDATSLTVSAFKSNKTSIIGFDSTGLDIGNLNSQQRAQLGSCASDILVHKYLISENLIASNKSKSSRLYFDTFQNIAHSNIREFTAEISKIECFPDLFSLAMGIQNPKEVYPKLVQLRNSKNVVEFRDWIKDFSANTNIEEVSKAYLNAVTKPIGIMQSDEAKFMKTCVMGAIGASVGTIFDSAGPIVGFGVGLALDLIDQYFISELHKGWTPRMYFEELRSFSEENKLSF